MTPSSTAAKRARCKRPTFRPKTAENGSFMAILFQAKIQYINLAGRRERKNPEKHVDLSNIKRKTFRCLQIASSSRPGAKHMLFVHNRRVIQRAFVYSNTKHLFSSLYAGLSLYYIYIYEFYSRCDVNTCGRSSANEISQTFIIKTLINRLVRTLTLLVLSVAPWKNTLQLHQEARNALSNTVRRVPKA